MKKYWKNAKKTGKVREIRQSKKVGTMKLHFYNLPMYPPPPRIWMDQAWRASPSNVPTFPPPPPPPTNQGWNQGQSERHWTMKPPSRPQDSSHGINSDG